MVQRDVEALPQQVRHAEQCQQGPDKSRMLNPTAHFSRGFFGFVAKASPKDFKSSAPSQRLERPEDLFTAKPLGWDALDSPDQSRIGRHGSRRNDNMQLLRHFVG